MSDDSCIRQINGDETKEKEDEGGRKTDNILYSRQRTTTVVRDIPQTWRAQPPSSRLLSAHAVGPVTLITPDAAGLTDALTGRVAAGGLPSPVVVAGGGGRATRADNGLADDAEGATAEDAIFASPGKRGAVPIVALGEWGSTVVDAAATSYAATPGTAARNRL